MSSHLFVRSCTEALLRSLLTFFMAIVWLCFNDTNAATRCVAGVTILISVLLFGGIVYNADLRVQSQAAEAFKERMDRTKKLVVDARKVPRRVGTKIRGFSFDVATALKKKTRTLSATQLQSTVGRPLSRTSPGEIFGRNVRRIGRGYSSSWRSSDDAVLQLPV